LAIDAIEVAFGLGVLLLEAERRQIARDDDDVGLEIVQLVDRALEQIGEEVRTAAVQIRDLCDHERPCRLVDAHARSLGGPAGYALRPQSHPGPLLPCGEVLLEIPDFQAYRGQEPPRFANRAELECAKVLDFYGVPWDYEPRTFVLDRDEGGRVVEAFTPDFYLPEQDLYVEVTVMKQSPVTRKNRKLRKFRERYPGVRIKLFYKRDIERLAQRFRLDLAR